jgi:fumarylacetoacetase
VAASIVSPQVPVPPGSDFPLENLPYGVFARGGEAPRIGVAIGDHLLDLAPVLDDPVLARPTLNRLMSQGRARWSELRERVTNLLTHPSARLEKHLLPRHEVQMQLPFDVGDYVDFYASREHATNLGRMFRPDQEPLTPNWRWLPIGYHGRAGTVVVSGTPIRRPCGQRRSALDAAPTFGPSRKLDIEAELGFVVGAPSRLGEPVSVDAVRDHVFGVVLVNDWSARDIQAWEYVPLGPFLGKSFATTVSPWVVPLDALEAAMTPPQAQDPPPLPYLSGGDQWGLDVVMEVQLNDTVVSRPPFRGMYWTAAQMLAHMTANGASIRTGDLFASGTVSGDAWEERGSLIELSWNGVEPFGLTDGSVRSFLDDGDTVRITASASGANGSRIGFGEVTGSIAPAGCPDT